jgi:exopolyphosphatase/guanosine-5'-triphosphate,3'-diphosphate pyrophosphatase
LSDRRTVGVIDIGSTAIRLVVAEIEPDGHWHRLDRAIRPVALGRDVFMSGVLSAESMRQAIKILTGFRELLRGWQLDLDDVRVIATSAIREAKNRDTFVDRVQIRTGFQINIVEGIEENHLTYIAVQDAISTLRPQFSRSSAMILEVGGGTTEIMLLQRGKMVAAHSLRIGTVRMEQQVQPEMHSTERIEEYLRENIRVTREVLNTEMRLDRVRFFVAVGGDARLAARREGRQEAESFWVVEKKDFDRFVQYLRKTTLDETVRELGVSYSEAEGLVPALLTYKLFLDATSADQVIVPDVSIREGVLMSFALGSERLVEEQFYSQVITSAIGLGRKFHFDEKHALHVARLGLQIFDQFQEDHGMDKRARLLLEVAAILHDIGNFIRAIGHHKHGQYIVENSEIFGFSRADIRIVGNVVRYHRKSGPNSAHVSYMTLRREHRITVLKLAAILRVADALDRGHAQRVKNVTMERQEDDMIFQCDYSGDISVEKYGVQVKGNMFEEVFGYRVVIV